MAASQKSAGSVLLSLSPSGRFYNSWQPSAIYSSSSAASSANYKRATSPTRISLYGSSGSPAFVRFISVAGGGADQVIRRQSHRHRHHQKITCMCSPTTHLGSFRCSLHKSIGSRLPPVPTNRLNARRSAMTNSLVRIRGVEGGDLVRQALAALIRPSSHHQRRHGEFQLRPVKTVFFVKQSMAEQKEKR